ncbi:MarR family winged helix-turn-helix transcriptional regulator [Rhizobium halophytocola]|uniref:DNA-binding MarR family transcriptional regulator n=1 Tax=Rhizobium halophytocola TaxID=735519 RepID=A0ABS4E3K3_9HYPH|nr:MarR family transcriptional regulator [Rhizobium halophytocola]MBP1852526.1 DNA-binding MarR family transcriptional regulator [Rhizobium halophytocola]
MTAGPKINNDRSRSDALAPADHVDRLRRQWRAELSDLDTTPMAILGRAKRLSDLLAPGIERLFAEHGLDRGEFDVIASLRRAGPPYELTPTDLYTQLMLSSGGLTHRLGRLEKAGLVCRRKSEQDGRSLLVALTETGQARAETAFRADMAEAMKALAPLTDAEREMLAGLLRKLLLPLESR